ncbi:MAG: PD-(D/E)XK nuclease family protein [Actinomycetota bacterium]|nr:PD-(D/E)XK nuclease family protein [Actinomycetota bacterium]
MVLPLPASLSPSKVSSFKDCGLAFRLSTIDHLPEPPSAPATKGTLVHRALQMLMWEEPEVRTLPVALDRLDRAAEDVLTGPEYEALELSTEERVEFLADAASLIRGYFTLEDPTSVRVIGTELKLSVQVGSLTLRGIIDRLELDEDGALVVTDYKTGRAPSARVEQARLGGVHFYAFLCEEVFGRRPARIQLLHLREPLSISTIPSDQSIKALQGQARAVWSAVELACEREDFRPKPGRACSWCGFHAYCPAVGGDLASLPASP